MNETVARIQRLVTSLQSRQNRVPTPDEIAQATGLSLDKVETALSSTKDAVSMDAGKNTETGETTGLNLFLANDLTPRPDDIIHDRLLHEALFDALQSLSAKERAVIEARFGLFDRQVQTLEQIGQRFGVTRERVRQIEGKALRHLRHPSRSKRLEDFYL
jgi:RNA polymerase primary sigma factor